MAGSSDILVVGGNSRIGVALTRLLGDRASHAVRRSTGRPREFVVEDYGALPPAAMEGVNCVINCVGISTGTPMHLYAVNAELPNNLGEMAKLAGVRRLIHISSFSVYGNADAIGKTTCEAPASDYGRSKQAGDAALLDLANDRFAVTILRLPLIYGHDVAGKLGQLLRLWTMMRLLPVPANDIHRAMIGVDLSAEVIARLVMDPPAASASIVFAADARPFAYADAARARRERLYRLPIPRSLTRLAEHTLPTIGARLFASSRLAEEDNLAIRFGLPSRLYSDIAAADLRYSV